jgi:hypothetical protein
MDKKNAVMEAQVIMADQNQKAHALRTWQEQHQSLSKTPLERLADKHIDQPGAPNSVQAIAMEAEIEVLRNQNQVLAGQYKELKEAIEMQ